MTASADEQAFEPSHVAAGGIYHFTEPPGGCWFPAPKPSPELRAKILAGARMWFNGREIKVRPSTDD